MPVTHGVTGSSPVHTARFQLQGSQNQGFVSLFSLYAMSRRSGNGANERSEV